MMIFNSRSTSCKSPFGAVKIGEKIDFSVFISKAVNQQEVFLKIFPIDEMEKEIVLKMEIKNIDNLFNEYKTQFISKETGVFSYYFETLSDKERTILKKNDSNNISAYGRDFWNVTIYEENWKDNSLGDGIIYQIFPDRFKRSLKVDISKTKSNLIHDRVLRSDWGNLPEWQPNTEGKILNNDYFLGNLKGITEKLHYIHSLGVSTIYLNPIFEAHSNHRYNTANYMKIDPILGTEDDFKELCEKAKSYGVSIILDGVFNHTGSDSIYFNKEKRYGMVGAYNDKSSPYYPWYKFRKYPDDYESWWGIPTLPHVNEDEESFINYICGKDGVIEKWLKLGASGYRLDVVDEIPDTLLDKIYETVKRTKKDGIVIGEVWEDATLKISYGKRRRYLLGNQLDTVMNYPFKNEILSYIRYGTANKFYETIMSILENYPKPAINMLMNFISTHDTARAITSLVGEEIDNNNRLDHHENHFLSKSNYEHGKKLFVLASILQFGLPGIPCIYYGDEAGLSGYRDPFNRVCYPWGYEDIELIKKIQALGSVRKDNKELKTADFIPVIFKERFCIFKRVLGDKNFIFIVNRSDSPITLPNIFKEDTRILFLEGEGDLCYLAPFSGGIYYFRD